MMWERLRPWLDERLPLADLIETLRHKTVPHHRYSIWYYFGGMTLFLFGIQVGTGALLLGTALGFYWSHQLQGHAWNADAKEILAILILAAYGAYLWLGRTTAWRGARAAGLCVANFLLVLFSYTIVNLYLTRYHRYF